MVILAHSYEELLELRKRILAGQPKNDYEIYTYITMYSKCLNWLIKSNLIPANMTKNSFQDDLDDFANRLLKCTKKTYKELDLLFNTQPYYISPNYVNVQE